MRNVRHLMVESTLHFCLCRSSLLTLMEPFKWWIILGNITFCHATTYISAASLHHWLCNERVWAHRVAIHDRLSTEGRWSREGRLSGSLGRQTDLQMNEPWMAHSQQWDDWTIMRQTLCNFLILLILCNEGRQKNNQQTKKQTMYGQYPRVSWILEMKLVLKWSTISRSQQYWNVALSLTMDISWAD